MQLARTDIMAALAAFFYSCSVVSRLVMRFGTPLALFLFRDLASMMVDTIDRASPGSWQQGRLKR